MLTLPYQGLGANAGELGRVWFATTLRQATGVAATGVAATGVAATGVAECGSPHFHGSCLVEHSC